MRSNNFPGDRMSAYISKSANAYFHVTKIGVLTGWFTKHFLSPYPDQTMIILSTLIGKPADRGHCLESTNEFHLCESRRQYVLIF
jgi:hypothetical protein